MALDAEEVCPTYLEGKVVREELFAVINRSCQPVDITSLKIVISDYFELVGIEKARMGLLLLLEVKHQSANLRGEVFESVGSHICRVVSGKVIRMRDEE